MAWRLALQPLALETPELGQFYARALILARFLVRLFKQETDVLLIRNQIRDRSRYLIPATNRN